MAKITKEFPLISDEILEYLVGYIYRKQATASAAISAHLQLAQLSGD